MQTDAASETSERLSFTLFLALAIHALIIFGVSFGISFSQQLSPTLEITFATHKAEQAPEKADYLAQFDQQASGSTDKAQELSTQQTAEFADAVIRDITPVPTTQASQAIEPVLQQQITTTHESTFKLPQIKEPDPFQPTPEQGEVNDIELRNVEIASLRAKLDQQRQAYAKRPRIRRLTSVATKASYDAEYLYKWSSKVEFVGNRNYPEQALRSGTYGKLRLSVIVNANGTIDSAEVLQSSGHRILDEAALQIVYLSSPFPAFPAEIRKNTDQLEIIRTWRFEITGLSTDL